MVSKMRLIDQPEGFGSLLRENFAFPFPRGIFFIGCFRINVFLRGDFF